MTGSPRNGTWKPSWMVRAAITSIITKMPKYGMSLPTSAVSASPSAAASHSIMSRRANSEPTA